MNKKLLFVIPFISIILFSCNEDKSKEESSEESQNTCSCTCTCDQSSNSEEESGSSEGESSSSEQSPTFTVKFHVDTTKLDNWNPPASGYFVHAWGAKGGFDTWGDAVMTPDSAHQYYYSYNINNGETIAGVILAFKQGNNNKQTVDINCNISAQGEYQIKYNDADWPDGKMSATLELIH